MKRTYIKYEYSIILASIILMLGGNMQSKSKKLPNPTIMPIDNLSVYKSTFDTLIPNTYHILKKPEPLSSHMLSKFMFSPRVISVSRTNAGVSYTFNNGETIERSGGSIAWRNNNPGCIRYSGKAVAMGAIGTANGFAIFPDEATGMRAIKTLLSSDAYCNLSIASAIGKYAPPHENNTERYIRSLCNLAGVSRHTKLRELNDTQLNCVVTQIRTLEGWIIGTETFTSKSNFDFENPKRVSTPNDIKTLYTRCTFFDHSI